MAIKHVRKTLTLTGSGLQTVSVLASDSPHVDFGLLHTVVARISSTTHPGFSAGAIRACRFPDRIVTAVDHIGRPTAAISAFDAPDEDVFYKSGAFGAGILAAMVASATAAFLTETIPVEDRRGCKGPWCISFQGNGGGAGTTVFVLDFEFDEANR